MDRQIVYPGSIPLETDLLNTNKYAMIGQAKLAAAMMGTTTYLRGLTCTPSSPASMVINIARGEIYSVQNVDNSAYSSLAADTTNTILKQGIVMSSTAFTLTAPTTAGQSINYLIQVTYSDIDSGATVLPYYNAANPSVAYSGPNNSGTAQNTVRSGVCTVALKAGVVATTGTQTTPSVDTGYTAAWVVTVAQGATTVTAANISVAANAPFLPVAGLVAAIQQNTMSYAADTGAANAYAAQFVPSIPTLTDGMRFTFKAKVANTGASTFAANGGSAYPLYSHAHQALQGGEIFANGLIEVEWNSTLTAWVLCGNSGGALPVAAATQSNHALQLGQAIGRLLGPPIVMAASGTYTPSPLTKSIRIRAVGGGGGGGGGPAAASGQQNAAQGGQSGAYAEVVANVSSSSYAVTVGTAGVRGTATTAATAGGASSVAGILSVPGGAAGAQGVSNAVSITISNNAASTTYPTVTTGTTVVSIPANPGEPFIVVGINSAQMKGGRGGSNPFGIGGAPGVSGPGAIGRGSGAGGGGCSQAQGGAGDVGGDGLAGLVVIEEYA